MYDSVFSKACKLGREQELFGLTKEQKEFYDTTEAYHRAMDESEILGDDANIAPEDFFVSWEKLFIFFYSKCPLLYTISHNIVTIVFCFSVSKAIGQNWSHFLTKLAWVMWWEPKNFIELSKIVFTEWKRTFS